MPENKIALVILAGGKSSRMGREKSDLILNGNTFLEIQIEKENSLESKKFIFPVLRECAVRKKL